MIPYRVARVSQTPLALCVSHVALVIETRLSDDWREIPRYSVEVQRRGWPVITLLVHELPFGTDRMEAIQQANTLVGITARADAEGRFGMTEERAA